MTWQQRRRISLLRRARRWRRPALVVLVALPSVLLNPCRMPPTGPLLFPVPHGQAMPPPPARTLTAEAATLGPDGATVWVVSEGLLRRLDLQDLRTLAAWPLALTHRATSLAVTKDGVRAAVLAAGDGVVLVHTDTGEVERLPSPAWSTVTPFHDGTDVHITDDHKVHVAGGVLHAPIARWGPPAPRCLWAGQHECEHWEPAPPDAPWTWGRPDEDLTWVVHPGRKAGSTFHQTSSDGRWHLYLPHPVRGALDTPALLHSLPILRGPHDPPLRRPPAATLPPALSPRGRWVVTAHGTELSVWDLRTGEGRTLPLPEDNVIGAVAWSSDGTTLAVNQSPNRAPRAEAFAVFATGPDGAPQTPPVWTYRAATTRSFDPRAPKALAVHPDRGVALAGEGHDHAGQLLLVSLTSTPTPTTVVSTLPPPRAPFVAFAASGADVWWQSGQLQLQQVDPADGRAVREHPLTDLRAAPHFDGFDDGDAVVGAPLGYGVPSAPQARVAGRRRVSVRILSKLVDDLSAAVGRQPPWVAWRSDGVAAGLIQDAVPISMSADGSFAWSDKHGRVFVGAGEEHPPRLLSGPLVSPSGATFSDLGQITLLHHHAPATTWSLSAPPASAPLVMAAQRWPSEVLLPGVPRWLGTATNGELGAVADEAGVVWVLRKGGSMPFLVIVDPATPALPR